MVGLDLVPEQQLMPNSDKSEAGPSAGVSSQARHNAVWNKLEQDLYDSIPEGESLGHACQHTARHSTGSSCPSPRVST